MPPTPAGQHGIREGHFSVDCKDYQILLASHPGPLRTGVAQLVEKLYAARGLSAPHAGQPGRGRQTTLAACRDGTRQVFGTVTLGLDAPGGLFADDLYHEQINQARKSGGRVCEATRLALDPEFRSSRALAELFHLIFILARLVHRMTDLFIEVHPHHSSYYQRILGYHRVGPERICPRVGAPAVLLWIDLREAEQRIHLPEKGRSVCRQFFPPETQKHLYEQLREHVFGMSAR